MGIFNLEHIDPSLIPGAMLTAEYLEKDMVTDRRVDILTEKGASGLSLRLDGNTARITSVSYTHLDVYKRQNLSILCKYQNSLLCLFITCDFHLFSFPAGLTL